MKTLVGAAPAEEYELMWRALKALVAKMAKDGRRGKEG